MSLPPISSPPTDRSPTVIFDTLAKFLTAPSAHPLEIEILPSSHPTILHEAPSLGIPKHLLLSTYPIARAVLLSYTKPSPGSEEYPTGRPPPSPSALNAATQLLLLVNPEHLTAANTRKRVLLTALRASDSCSSDTHVNTWRLVSDEIAVSTTLLTSPLPRHAKSPNLWSHRYWLARTQWDLLTTSKPRNASYDSSKRDEGANNETQFVEAEMEVVLKAAARKIGNYHAFMYARRITDMASPEAIGRKVLERMREWCLGHPRDVSGWGYLAFLVSRKSGGEYDGPGGETVVQGVRKAVEEFVERVGWRGESVEGFLRAVGQVEKISGQLQHDLEKREKSKMVAWVNIARQMVLVDDRKHSSIRV